jgi:hypothetical protein
MKVRMLRDAPGSPDGVTVNQYANGEVYEVTESLGDAFLAEGFAEAYKDVPAPVVVPPAPAPKATAPQENKSDG